jgi:site-specific recombinase XerD
MVNAVEIKEFGITPAEEGAAPGLKDLLAGFRVANEVEGKSPRTTNWYQAMLAEYVAYIEAHGLETGSIGFGADVVRGYILYLQHRRRYEGHPHTPVQAALLSPKTVQCHVRALKAFGSWLCREGYTADNRLTNVRIPKAPEKMIEPLTPAEIRRILRSIDRTTPMGLRNHAMVVLMLDTGLRASEVTSLELAHLNLEKGYLKVMGKGAKERFVPIGDYTRMILRGFIEKGRPKPSQSTAGNVFLSAHGQPLTPNAIKLIFSRLVKTCGLKRLHAHLCRHTFATAYLVNGGDIFSLKAILGHTTLEMVNHYLHFSSAQVAVMHHKFSPMDKMKAEEG